MAMQDDDEDESKPFLRQKEIKHKLVGLEKMSRALETQLSEHSENLTDLVAAANEARRKCFLSTLDAPLSVEEVRDLDESMMELMFDDVLSISSFINEESMKIADGLNKWLEVAESYGLLVSSDFEDEESQCIFSEKIISHIENQVNSHGIIDCFNSLCSSYARLSDNFDNLCTHIDLNVVAFRKILKRREKHVPKDFMSSKNLVNCEELQFQLHEETLTRMFNFLKSSLHDISKRCSKSQTSMESKDFLVYKKLVS